MPACWVNGPGSPASGLYTNSRLISVYCRTGQSETLAVERNADEELSSRNSLTDPVIHTGFDAVRFATALERSRVPSHAFPAAVEIVSWDGDEIGYLAKSWPVESRLR